MLHYPDADAQGAAVYFDGKVKTLERLDSAVPQILALNPDVGSSRVDLQACKLEYSIVSPK